MSDKLRVTTPWQDCFIISFSDTPKAKVVNTSGKKVLEDLDVIGMSKSAFLEMLTINNNKLLSARLVLSSLNKKPILIYTEGLKGGGACFSKPSSKSSYDTNITQEGRMVSEPKGTDTTRWAYGSPKEAGESGPASPISTESMKSDITVIPSINKQDIQQKAHRSITDTIKAIRSENMSQVRIIELSRLHPSQISSPKTICIELLKILSEELLWGDSWVKIRHEIARMARRFGFAFFTRNMNSIKLLKGIKREILTMITQVKEKGYKNKSIVGDYGLYCELVALEYLYADIKYSQEWFMNAIQLVPDLIRNYTEKLEPESWEAIMIGYKRLRGRYNKNYLKIYSILDILDSSIETKEVFDMCIERVTKNIEELGWKEIYPILHLFETAIYMNKISPQVYLNYFKRTADMFLRHKNYRIREKAASILSLLIRNRQENVQQVAIKLLNENYIIEKHPVVIYVLAHPISSSELYMSYLKPFINETTPKCHHNLKAFSSVLFGRDSELETISNELSNDGVSCAISISGPAGIGKSSLAHQYSLLNIGKYDIIWWINSESQSSFNHSLYELAADLKLDFKNNNQISNDIKAYLNNSTISKLLVFDNIKDANIIDEFLTTKVHCILISEDPIPNLNQLRLSSISPEASYDLFRYYLNLECDQTHFSDLLKLIGDSPVALGQAASYLNRTQSNIKDLINSLSNSTQIDEALKQIVFSNLSQLGNESRFILKILCYGYNKEVPYCMLHSLLKDRYTNISILQFNACIKELKDMRLLYYDISNQTLMLDSVIQRYIRLFLQSYEFYDSYYLISSLKEVFLRLYKYEKNSNITLLKQLTPHIQVFLEKHPKAFDKLSYAQINIELAQILFYIYQDTSTGTPIIHNLFNLLTNSSLEDLKIAKVYHQTANLFRLINNSKSAEVCLIESLEIYDIQSSSDTKDRAIAHNDLADLYLSLSEYTKAQENYEKAINILEKLLRADHPLLASSYNSLGVIYLTQGDLVKSERFLIKSKDIREKILPMDSPLTANTYNSLGELYYTQKDYNKAEEYLLKSEDIRATVLPEDSTCLAKSYNNLGLLYSAKNELQLALDYYNKSIKIYKKVLKPNSIELAKVYHNLAGLYQSRKEYDKAESFYLKSINIYNIKFTDRISLANIYHNLATLYQTISEHDKAIRYYEKCLRIRIKELPPHSLSTAKTYFNVGSLCYKLGKIKSAEILLERCKKIRQRALPPNHPSLKELYKKFGLIYEARGFNMKAETYFEMARN